MYEAYVRGMRPRILGRLRRRHAADFREERDLALYVSRKTLVFLEFDPAWVRTRETLDNTIVEAHVGRLLDNVLGEDQEVVLPSSRGLLERNRKSVRDFAASAISVVLAWCRRKGVHVPEPWSSEDPQSVIRHLENAGLLDFELVRDTQIPGLCNRAACWPDGMPQSLEPASLGLDQATVEEKRAAARGNGNEESLRGEASTSLGPSSTPRTRPSRRRFGNWRRAALPITTVGLSAAVGRNWPP